MNTFKRKETDQFVERIEFNVLGNVDHSVINTKSYKIKR